MPICPIGAMYNGIVHVEKAEQAGAKLIENAVVFKLEVGADKRITAALYKDPQGNEHRVEGKLLRAGRERYRDAEDHADVHQRTTSRMAWAIAPTWWAAI